MQRFYASMYDPRTWFYSLQSHPKVALGYLRLRQNLKAQEKPSINFQNYLLCGIFLFLFK